MNRTRIIYGWSFMVGAMDALTGLLLILVPEIVLRLLGIAALTPDSWIFLRWIGVFVMSVGLSYALVLRGRQAGETVWVFTGGIRMMVGVFLGTAIACHHLNPVWWVVAASDSIVALFQFAGLRAGWWKGDTR